MSPRFENFLKDEPGEEMKMNSVQPPLTVVIRTCDERTVELSRKLVCGQVPEENLFIICEKPFFKAVQKTFEIGRKCASRYLIGLDADILLFPDAVEYMLYEAGTYVDTDFFRIDFPIYDKFRGRTTGVHFYNNNHSGKFLDFLSSRQGENAFLRPEFDNVKAFSLEHTLSYGTIPHFIVGKHDYFQYYKDILQKYVVRRKRCIRDKCLDRIVDLVKQKSLQSLDDFDYALALEALSCDEAELPALEALFEKYGIEEKAKLPDTSFSFFKDMLSQNKIMSKL